MKFYRLLHPTYREAQDWVNPSRRALANIKANDYRVHELDLPPMELLIMSLRRIKLLGSPPFGPIIEVYCHLVYLGRRYQQLAPALVQDAESWLDYLCTSYYRSVSRINLLQANEDIINDIYFLIQERPAYKPMPVVQRKRKRVVIVEKKAFGQQQQISR